MGVIETFPVPKDQNSMEAQDVEKKKRKEEGWVYSRSEHRVRTVQSGSCRAKHYSHDPELKRIKMNRWRKSVGEIQARRRPVLECERGQAALSKVTACYQQLASFLGSISDCSRLREELEETRAVAYTICKGLHRKLVALLTEGELAQDEREEVERLWVLFISGLEMFQQDLRKAAALQDLFPLTQKRDRRALLNTGSSGGGSGVAARAAAVQPPWIRAGGDDDPSPDVCTHVLQLEGMAQEMLQKVNVPFWSVEATQEAWAEEGETEPDGEEEEETLEVEVVPTEQDKGRGCCRNNRCRLGWMLCLMH